MDQMVDVVQRQVKTSDGKMGEDILLNIIYSEYAIG